MLCLLGFRYYTLQRDHLNVGLKFYKNCDHLVYHLERQKLIYSQITIATICLQGRKHCKTVSLHRQARKLMILLSNDFDSTMITTVLMCDLIHEFTYATHDARLHDKPISV
jgi:hypothetical protein